MAGRGFAPKQPDRRAGHSPKDPNPLHIVPASPATQPKLPTIYQPHPTTGRSTRFAWPARTRDWWQMWAESPLSTSFTENDWSELLDTALIHARFWRGEVKLAGELRLRVAKFGATPEDRQRLRIGFAPPDPDKPASDNATPQSARARRGPLKAVPTSKAAGDG